MLQATSGLCEVVSANILGETNFVTMLGRLRLSQADYLKDGKPMGICVTDGAVCRRCRCYLVPVRFLVRSLDQEMTLSTQLRPSQPVVLGEFPHSVQWFVDCQGLEAIFGTPNHGTALRSECPECQRKLGQLCQHKSSRIGAVVAESEQNARPL